MGFLCLLENKYYHTSSSPYSHKKKKKMIGNVIGLRLFSPSGYRVKPLDPRCHYDHQSVFMSFLSETKSTLDLPSGIGRLLFSAAPDRPNRSHLFVLSWIEDSQSKDFSFLGPLKQEGFTSMDRKRRGSWPALLFCMSSLSPEHYPRSTMSVPSAS